VAGSGPRGQRPAGASPLEPRPKVPILGWVVGLAIFLALVMVIHASVGWRALVEPWRSLPPVSLAVALLMVLGSYAIRTVRIHQYFQPDTGGRFLRTFRLVLLHNLLNNLLPMRSGEASFPILMKRDFRVPFSRSVPGLVYLRLMDFHFLLVMGAVVLFAREGQALWLAMLLLAPLPFLVFRGQRRLESYVAERDNRMIRLLKKGLAGLPSSPSLFWVTWLWTGVNWSAKLLAFGWILQVFVPMPYPVALLGSITGEMSSVLPVHGLAGAGTYEAGILASLIPLGIRADVALAGAVNLHLFVLGASVLGAALGMLLLAGPGPKEESGGGA
jgi:uncharacterized membrane protein YbhN (UPF0104 family)